LLESMAIDRLGNAYVTYSASTAQLSPGGGIMVVHDIVARVGGEIELVDRDREIAGASTGLVDPKGIALVGPLLAVADHGAQDIKLFSAHASGDVAPLVVISDIDDATSVWGVAAGGSSLYVTTTDGRVLAYDDFFTDFGQSGPTRVIEHTAGVDARGIALYAGSLFVADVGVVGVATDGAIYRIDDADLADGVVEPGWTVAGANSGLADPVGLAIEVSSALYVVDRGAEQLSTFAAPLTSMGSENISPATTTAVVGAESVLMLPSSQF